MTSNTYATAVAAIDQTLTAAELEQARLFLDQTRNGVLGALKDLSEDQWTFKPAGDHWSIAQNSEHIALVQELVLGPIREQLAKSPPAPVHPDYQKVDEIVISQFPNRLKKFPSPSNPVGELARSEAVDRVVKNYARLTEYLETTPDLRLHAVDAPPLKAISKGAYDSMDGYQWILAAAAHTERHTKQILEVKADRDFPLK